MQPVVTTAKKCCFLYLCFFWGRGSLMWWQESGEGVYCIAMVAESEAVTFCIGRWSGSRFPGSDPYDLDPYSRQGRTWEAWKVAVEAGQRAGEACQQAGDCWLPVFAVSRRVRTALKGWTASKHTYTASNNISVLHQLCHQQFCGSRSGQIRNFFP